MANPIGKLTRSENMARIRSANTKPELAVRRIAHAMGYRFRIHRRDLPGKPDLVFPSRRKVILVHGCFWHQHSCRAGRRQPSTRSDYWGPKLARNVARDDAVRSELSARGWEVLVIWECEVKDEEWIGKVIREFLS